MRTVLMIELAKTNIAWIHAYRILADEALSAMPKTIVLSASVQMDTLEVHLLAVYHVSFSNIKLRQHQIEEKYENY